MALEHVIYQGSDYLLEFQLYEQDGITPVLTSSLTGALVYLYYGPNRTLLQRYSINALASHNNSDISYAVSPTNQINVKLQAEVTREALPGTLIAEIKARKTNADYSNSTYDSIVSEVVLGQVRPSLTGDVDTF